MNSHSLLIILLTLLASACSVASVAPRAPCDEPIKDKQIYQDIILSNPIVARLNGWFKFYRADISECFVKGELSIGLLYHLPAEMSSYGVSYASYLALSYSKDGHIDAIVQETNERQPLDYEKIVAMLKNTIASAEANPSPRIKEFIGKVAPTQGKLNSCCSIWLASMPGPAWGEIRYDPKSKLVIEYSVRNSFEWIEFPEIEAAHGIVEKELLVGSLSQCKIGREQGHSYTIAKFHDSETAPWPLTVALICDDGWKDAFVRINHDGSYDSLGIRTEYKNK